jgi:peptide/nickel transport system substrate-binding protein
MARKRRGGGGVPARGSTPPGERRGLTRRELLTHAAVAAGGVAAASLLEAVTRDPALAAHGPLGTLAQAPPAPRPQRGGQIIVGLSQEPQNFNPLLPWIEVQRGIHMSLYDGLWRIDPKGKYVPNLATEIPGLTNGGISGGGTAFTIKLRKDAKWHDGRPLTARDVVFTWQTLMNPKVTAYSTVGYDQIASMEAPDDYTIKFTLKEPYAPILAVLADMYIVPEHVLAKSSDINKDEFNTRKPIGSGAFKFVDWVAGDHITLEANGAYHGPGPYADRLIYKYIPDLTVLFTQFKTGEIDVTGLQGIPIDLYPEAKTLANAKLFSPPGTAYESVALNFLNPLFQDRRVRQALYYGMDKKPIVDKIFLGLVPEAETYVPPQSWAYNPRVKGAHKYDPEQAKQLLERAGWKVGPDGIRVKGGQRLAFDCSTTAGNKQREQIQQLLQQQWKQIGVEIKINNMPAAVLFGDFYRLSKFQTVVIGISMGPDPDHSFRLHSRYIPVKGGKGRNAIAYENPEVDKLLDAGVREIDQEKRKKIYNKLQEVLVIDLPHLPIYHYVTVFGTKARIQGFQPNANMIDVSWNTNEWWIRR